MRLINTIILLLLFFSCGIYAQKNVKKALTIQEQGSFAIGGTITTDENGNQFHGDHGYVFYQKPIHPHKYPLVFLHGIYQSSKTWESTPDGREGFQNIFIRHNFST